MTALTIIPEYAALLNRVPPKVIKTQAENDEYLSILEEMERRRDHLSSDEQEFAELLTLLVEDFEERHYQLRPSTPLEVIAELVEANNLKQKDLVDVFGTEKVVSEVMAGNRELNKDEIKKLSSRFNVSPELFF